MAKQINSYKKVLKAIVWIGMSSFLLVGCSKEQKNNKVLTKAKEKISQVISDIEELEMSDIKVKTKETLGQIKQKILSIHL